MTSTLHLELQTCREGLGCPIMTFGLEVQAAVWWIWRLGAEAVAGTLPEHHGTSWSGHIQVCPEVSHRPQQLEEQITPLLNKWVHLLCRNVSQTSQCPQHTFFVLFSLSFRCNAVNALAFCIIHIAIDSYQTLHVNKLTEIILSTFPSSFL